MSRLLSVVGFVAVLFGVAYFVKHYTLDVKRDETGKLQSATVTPKEMPAAPAAAGEATGQPVAATTAATPGAAAPGAAAASKRSLPPIRIATFNTTHLNDAKLADQQVTQVLTRLFPKFDLIAVQDIQAPNQGPLVRLIEQINAASGRKFRFVTAPNAGLDADNQYSAFIFDDAKLAIDHSLAYWVQDPAGLFRHVPLVASFCARGPSPEEAFTFKLVNVRIDRDRLGELDSLDDVFRAVRDDSSREDDVIVLGDFGVESNGPGEENFGEFGAMLDLTAVVHDVPTTLRARKPVDNILFDRRATAEFTGRAGVTDLMREFDLTMRESLEVSNHQPVWAEFDVYEGGKTAHLAEGGGQPARK